MPRRGAISLDKLQGGNDAPRLPLELLERTIDLLDDRHTFAVCGLVCRALLLKTRRELFGLTRLAPADYDSFLDVLEGSRYISDTVTQLCIAQPQNLGRHRGVAWHEPPDPTLLVPILQCLPNIRALALDNFGTHTMSGIFLTMLPELLPRVEELHILRCDISAEDFMRIACSCPRLRDLRYTAAGNSGTQGEILSPEFMDAMHDQVGGRIKLHKITWCCDLRLSGPHLDCVLQGPFDLTPSSMDVFLTRAVVSGTQRLVDAAGPSLNHLTLRVSTRFLGAQPGDLLDTSTCACLTSLFVHRLDLLHLHATSKVLRQIQDTQWAQLERLYIRLGGAVHYCGPPDRVKQEVSRIEQLLSDLDSELARIGALREDGSRLVVTLYVDSPSLCGPTADIMEMFPFAERHFPALLETGCRLRVLAVEIDPDCENRVPFEMWSLNPVFDSESKGSCVAEMDVPMI